MLSGLALGTVLLLGCGAAAASVLLQGLLPTGSQTASITVVQHRNGTLTLSGTVAGKNIVGHSSNPVAAVNRKLCPKSPWPAETDGATYTGTFDGTNYVLHACLAHRTGPSGTWTLKLNGHWGHDIVAGTTTINTVKGATPETKGPFSGHIGSQHLSGTATVTAPSRTSFDLKVVAHFTITNT